MNKVELFVTFALAPVLLNAHDVIEDLTHKKESPPETQQSAQPGTLRKKDSLKKFLETETATLRKQCNLIQQENSGIHQEMKIMHDKLTESHQGFHHLKTITAENTQLQKQGLEKIAHLEKQIANLAHNLENNEQEYVQKLIQLTQQLRRAKGLYALGGSLGTMAILSYIFYCTPEPHNTSASVIIPQ